MKDITSVQVKAQLDRVLHSAGFVAGQKLADFLRYVVEQKLNGQSNDVKQYAIAVNALGYQADFDPQENPTVRIMARRLRRKLDDYYQSDGSEDPIRIDLPKGGYTPVFSLNPGGQGVAESVPEHGNSISAAGEHVAGVPGGPSIAIMLFRFLGNESEHNFIASGLSEEITIALTRFQDFFVVGPLSRDFLKNSHGGTRAIGKEFEARFLLDGTVRLAGKTLRLTTTLTDTSNDRKLWGQRLQYNIETTSFDQMEQEILGQIVTTIADNSGVIPRVMAREILSHQDDSLSDYSAILRFHHHIRVLHVQSLIDATEALEKIVSRDPDHDLALALLADLISTPYWLGYTDDQYDLGRGAEMGRRALALNPNSQPAYIALAINYFSRSKKELFLNAIEQALRLNPNHSNYLGNCALFLMGTDQREEGLALIRKAMRWNPHHPGWYHFVLFLYHYYHGDFKTALVDAHGFNTPDYIWDPLVRAAVSGQLGRREEAKKAAGELLTLVPDFEHRGRDLMRRMVFEEANVEMLLDGLRKAGVNTS